MKSQKLKINQNEDIESLRVEILSLKEKIVNIQKRYSELVIKHKELETENFSIKSNFGRQLFELKNENEINYKEQLNQLLKERADKSSKEEWEKIIDEMAHCINSDIFVAVSYLSRIELNTNAEIALCHTMIIRDLINLIMLYLKRDVIKFSGNFKELSIEDLVNDQIKTIKRSLSTLRLSTDNHQELLQNLKIQIEISGDTNFKIVTEFKDAISIIIKDLLRNAFKNTSEENPQIKIKIESVGDSIKLLIVNNRLIEEDILKWFNGESEIEPEISKSSKVGLRVIIKWTKLLGISAKFSTEKINQTTIAEIIFPKEIKYEK